MQELFSGNLAPITDTIGFLRCDAARATRAFLDWQGGIQAKRGVTLVESRPQGDLGEVLQALLPLTSVERRRYLFVPTHSEWVAFWDNGHEGTDAFSAVSHLADVLSCDALRMTYVPEEGRGDRLPATVMEIFAPHKTDFLNILRAVSASFDGSKWAFSADGEVQPFEDVARYSERSIKKRFTGPLLETYLKALGIAAFDEGFYKTGEGSAVLLEKQGPIAPASRTFGLARG